MSLNKTFRLLLCIAAIILCVRAQGIPPNTPPTATAKSGSTVRRLNSQQKAENPKENQPDSQPISTCDKCLTCCPVQQPQAKTKEEQAKEDSLDVLYRRYLKATVWGVIGALIGLGFLIYQTVLTRRAANAAQLSAQAVIDSERAWLVVELVPTAIKHGNQRYVPDNYAGELSDADLSDGRQFEYKLKITNMGKTPALITKYTISRSNGTDVQLIDFELPYSSLESSGQRYIYTLDVDQEVGNYSADATVFFFGDVSYRHVFSNKDTMEEPFAYAFKRETGRLERIPVAEGKSENNPT